MRKTIQILSVFLSLCAFTILSLSISVGAEDSEKSKILNSSAFGDWAKAKKIKKTGKISLQAWEPYIEYAKTVPDSSLKKVMLQNTNNINIEYDEIWLWERDDLFTPAEKRKFSGQFDIHKIYWKNNKVQAFTLEKYFISNPVTKKKIGKHKITQVWDRDSVLREI